MGIFQNAVDTYDTMGSFAGVPVEGKEMLSPVGHMTTKASIEITIDSSGHFFQARYIEEKIVFPATEKSSGRTSAPSPHPLCDQLGYITTFDSYKHGLFMNQLQDWCTSIYSHPKANSVLNYLQLNTIDSDLMKSELLEFDEAGSLKNEKDFVCWRVLTGDADSGAVWEDHSLMESFEKYYLSVLDNSPKDICMISGKVGTVASQHIKGIVPINGNAKLISANDNTNFTYRGRFLDEREAFSISYESTQKAHNVLKWMIANDGISLGGSREMICWNPKGKRLPKPHSVLRKKAEEKVIPSEYKKTLNKIILGFRSEFRPDDIAVIAIFDAATSGRLSISYYNELGAFDFLERLRDWDTTCCWFDSRWGTSSPFLLDIVRFAFGTLRNGKMEVDSRIQSQQVQRLISCRIDRVPFPLDILRLLINKCSRLLIYEESTRIQLLFISCAAIKKYAADHLKEELSMALEPQKRNLSYQYGRLLAVMEKIERDTYTDGEKRETNAIRMQAVFVKRPGYAAGIIMNQLKTAYYPQLSPSSRTYYERLIGQIMAVISECGDNINQALDENYLLGYYLQKNEMYKKKETEINADEEEN